MAPVVELLIGLIFLYLILSLVVSSINEGIAGILGKRAVYLEKGIASLVGNSLKGDFYQHGLIRALQNDQAWMKNNRKPSYISATTFTDTILDLIRKSTQGSGSTAVPARAGASLSVQAPTDRILSEIRTGLAGLGVDEESRPLRETLDLFSREAKNVDDFRRKLEAWYDETMQRVSGWYKRFTRLMLFSIGIVLVLLINADTLNVANTLWRDSSVRSTIADQAAAFVQQGTQSEAQAKDALAKLEEQKLPLGWKFNAQSTDARRIPTNAAEDLVKLLGLLLTGIALTFGAPFWFDLLKKFVGIRSSGAEPQPAQTGPPSGAPSEPAKVEVTVKT
jgi:hypothetical protein